VSLQNFYRSMRGVSNFSIKRLSDDVLYSLPPVQNVNIGNGIEIKEQMGRDDFGREVRLFSFTTGIKPTIEITFGQMQKELLALAQGVKLTETSYTVFQDFSFLAKLNAGTGNVELAAVVSGEAGFGISEDVNIGLPNAPIASVRLDKISENLTQAAYAGYSGWRGNPKSFAIGANRAIRVSDDLVGKVVTLRYPVTGVANLMTALSVGPIDISGVVVDILDEQHILNIPAATVNPTDSGLDMGADTLTMRLHINYEPGVSTSWNLVSLKQNNKVPSLTT
jgi:hypothetical protein